MTQLQLVYDPIVVDLDDRAVRYYGDASVKYTWTPAVAGMSGAQVESLLEQSETVLRGARMNRGVLDLTLTKPTGISGYCGGSCEGGWIDFRGSAGVEFRRWGEDGERWEDRFVVKFTWPKVLALMHERARVEPNVKAARDVAEAVRLLAFYQRTYLNEKGQIRVGYGRDDWTPDPLLDGFRQTLREHGYEVPKDLRLRARGLEPYEPYVYVPPDPQMDFDEERRSRANDSFKRRHRAAA